MYCDGFSYCLLITVEERIHNWNILYMCNRYQLVTGLSSHVVLFHLSYY